LRALCAVFFAALIVFFEFSAIFAFAADIDIDFEPLRYATIFADAVIIARYFIFA